MFGPYIHPQYEAERTKTTAQQRASDIRRGEFAATISQQVRAITGLVRSLSSAVSAGRSGFATPPPAVVRCPDTIPGDVVEAASVSLAGTASWSDSCEA
jgi:hypothetical protein